MGLWRPFTLIAPVIAGLLWAGHRRARFAAYIFFSVLAARGAIGGIGNRSGCPPPRSR
jgi:hypothetical protein